MRIGITIMILGLCLAGCQKDPSPAKSDGNIDLSRVTLDSVILNDYLFDAKQLYMDQVYKNPNSSIAADPNFQYWKIQEILKIIQTVYDLDIPERDTVFSHYRIHNYPRYQLNHLSMAVDSSKPEIKNLLLSIFPTGNMDLDSLLFKYQYDRTTSVLYLSNTWAGIRFNADYNLFPVRSEFMKLDHIIHSVESPRFWVGDGDDITIEQNGAKAIITFSIGRGDCPAGCLYHRYWEFEVSNSKAVFIRSF